MIALRNGGNILLGMAVTGFGMIQLATQAFLKGLLPFKDLPANTVWVYLVSLVMIICGGFFILRKFMLYASGATGMLFLIFFLYPHLPRLLSEPRNPNAWTVALETLALATGAFMIWAASAQHVSAGRTRFPNIHWAGIISRYLFAFCLIAFGIQHFMYAEFIQTLIPDWIPGKTVWSYIVRFGFLLAALSLMINRQVRLGMLLLGILFLTWVVVLHAPRALAKMTDADEWASLCIALALSGIAFHTAGVGNMSFNTVSGRQSKQPDPDFIITT